MDKLLLLKRLSAFLIDLLISFLFAAYIIKFPKLNIEFVGVCYGSLMAYLIIPLAGFDNLFKVLIAGSYLLTYLFVIETIFKSSIGKMIFGLTVTYEDSIWRPLQVLFRNILLFVPFNTVTYFRKKGSWNDTLSDCKVKSVPYNQLFVFPKMKVDGNGLKILYLRNIRHDKLKNFLSFENVIKILFVITLIYVRIYPLLNYQSSDSEENLIYLRSCAGIMCFSTLALRRYLKGEKTEAIIYCTIILLYLPILETKLGDYSIIADCLIGIAITVSIFSLKYKTQFKNWIMETKFK